MVEVPVDELTTPSVARHTSSSHAPERDTSSPDLRPVRRPRFAMLDGLRICAALMVLLYHFTALQWSSKPWGTTTSAAFPRAWHVTAYGALGVQLFFLISGFVILMSSWGRTVPQFVASRVARLYPAYWLCVALTSFLLFVVWTDAKQISGSDALVNFTMLQHAQGARDVDSVYWTLWVELCFYLLVGLVALAGLTPNRIMALATIWPVVGALVDQSHNVLLTNLLEPQYASLFAGGMLIFLIHREGHSLLPWLLFGMNLALAIRATTVGTFAKIQRNTGHPLPDWTCALVIAAFFAAVAVVTLTPVNRIRWRWLTWAGLLTYPLYLIHEYWGLWLIRELSPHLSTPLTLVVVIVAALVAAALIHQIAERPFQKPLRRAVERSFTRTTRPSGGR